MAQPSSTYAQQFTAQNANLELATAEAFAGVNYFKEIDSTFKTNADADKLLGSDQKSRFQPAVDSIFNKFTVFAYSQLSSKDGYDIGGHFIGYNTSLVADAITGEAADIVKKAGLNSDITDGQSYSSTNSLIDKYTSNLGTMRRNPNSSMLGDKGYDVAKALSNPTAKQLVNWGGDHSAKTPVGFQPYALTDFFFCTYYGRIPNNRLVTLRRYPFPIGDSVRLSRTDMSKNAIPIAQAVTWFGSETTNQLSKLGLFSWDMPWKDISINEEQKIEGNEVTMESLTNLLANVKGGPALASLINTVYTSAAAGDDKTLQQLTGADKKIQDYMRNLYTTGPYWNRIYGPVNVINATSHRTRGVQTSNWQTTFPIKFSYKFRSFNGLSPKIVALDLISNFLNLTYNDAQFLGQLNRYFEKTGLKFSPTVTEALGEILTNWGTSFTGNNTAAYTEIANAFAASIAKTVSNVTTDPTGTAQKTIQATVMNKKLLGDAIPELLSIKSALSDRPVGEWHIVVGNPMNPIFVMGDLVCTDVKMEWDEEIGPDDFPTGCSFTVTLKQGKPRDKSAIERMLNGGQSGLSRAQIRNSSESDTFGTLNNTTWQEVTDNAAAVQTKLQQAYNGLGENSKAEFGKFRTRVNSAYKVEDPKTGRLNSDTQTLDNSLLMLYFQRRYATN